MPTKKTKSKALVPIANPEKKKHEKWDVSRWREPRDIIDFPRPFRWGILGAVSCGKSTLVLNYMVNAHKYDNIFLMHPQTYNPNIALEDECNNENCMLDSPPDIGEYKGVEFNALAYLPSMCYFDDVADKFNLFIIDDIDLCSYCQKRSEMRNERLNKLFSYVSSHKNVSIIVTSQDASSQLPGFVLKMTNVLTIYKVRDEYITQTIARKISTKYKRLKALLDLCKKKHDSITFDYTDDTEHPIRFNVYDDIEEEEDE